jgi:hypothetical protein
LIIKDTYVLNSAVVDGADIVKGGREEERGGGEEYMIRSKQTNQAAIGRRERLPLQNQE